MCRDEPRMGEQCEKCHNYFMPDNLVKNLCFICTMDIVKRKSVEIENDPVNNPAHYNNGKAKCRSCDTPIECIDVTRHMSFNLGNSIKYLWRWQNKGGLEDLKKARWHLEDAIKELEKQND